MVVLEGVEIGFGGSGRNVGLVNAGMWVMPDDLPRELGEVYGSRLLHMLGDGQALCSNPSRSTQWLARSNAAARSTVPLA